MNLHSTTSTHAKSTGNKQSHMHVCPWWIGYLLASPVRAWFEKPEKLVGPFVKAGDTVLDVGPGMGFFSLPAARLVGEKGRVVCVDLQEKMISSLKRRARRKGLDKIVEGRVCNSDSLRLGDLAGKVNTALAIHVIHEVPDPAATLREIAETLKPGGRLLLLEPLGHVSKDEFARTEQLAVAAGLRVCKTISLRKSHARIFEKPV